jgi:hypothetical protein
MTCPICGAPMAAQTLDGHLGTSVTIDLCFPCQVFWFDTKESLRLSPGAVLTLFRAIGERAMDGAARAPAGARPSCPRCQVRLFPTHDRQRNTPFQYLRCPKDHGRLITFVEFLREKDFIRPLSAQQIAELRQSVQVVNCSNCGAPIELANSSACGHCGSPLSMLDLKQTSALVATLREADRPDRPIDPTLPLRLERARREVEASFAGFEHHESWFGDVTRGGLVGAGLSALARWLKQQA